MRGPFGVAAVIASAAFVGPAVTSAATAAPHTESVTMHLLTCTRTSSGTCIRGGQFCPQAKWHKSGWDARGRRYVCKGDRVHPHWMIP